MKCVHIQPDRPPVVIAIDGALESLQKLVDGPIEALPFTDNSAAYVDEEAKVRDDPPPPNALATRLMNEVGPGLWPGDVILGPMVVVGPPDDEGNDTDVPDDVVALILNFRL